MPLTDRDDVRVAEIDEELISIDVSDEALERAVKSEHAVPVTIVFCSTTLPPQCPG